MNGTTSDSIVIAPTEYEKKAKEYWLEQLELVHSVYPPDGDRVVWSDHALALALQAAEGSSADSSPIFVDVRLSAQGCNATVRLAAQLACKKAELAIVSSSKSVSGRLPRLRADLDKAADDMDAFSALMSAVDAAKAILEACESDAPSVEPAQVSSKTPAAVDEDEVRAWFHFPSLSTRSKRKDLVDYAHTRGLTGFVLAGKPGLCLLEGRLQTIDAFWQAIKTESWADIPSNHKKVSERLRVPLVSGIKERRWRTMEEITDRIEKGGHRGNKSEMSEVRQYCDEHQVALELDHVLRI